MKHKPDLSRVPWTPFEECVVPDDPLYAIGNAPSAIYRNSRYQVAIFTGACDLGAYLQLSIKSLDRSARHDWRDLQRIKNELVGKEYEAIELYPAESRCVDTANQFFLFVFHTWVPPVGFRQRLIADGDGGNTKQRPFEERPADCLNKFELERLLDAARDRAKVARDEEG
jgi:hypothetical protein